MIKKFKLLSSSVIVVFTLASPLATYAMEPEEDHKPEPIARRFNLHTYMALGLGLTDQHMNPIYHSIPRLDESQRFLNGKLTYTDPKTNEVTQELKIPFKGTFDLSQCGDIANYITITTDPSVFFAIDKANPRLNILIAPHFLIKALSEDEVFQPFVQGILGQWDNRVAPIGIFWRMSTKENLPYYDYLITATVHEITSRNLYENWLRSIHGFENDFRQISRAFRIICDE
jgi:hypothetical protein